MSSRGDLSNKEIGNLMGISLRGEGKPIESGSYIHVQATNPHSYNISCLVTPSDALPPPPLASTYQRASRKGKRYY